MEKLKILFLCTGNSCRSQMAEGWARHLKGDQIESYSAGIEIHGLNPSAVKVMAEAGVDLSGHRSKHLNELKDQTFDYVITVCDAANESCPFFPERLFGSTRGSMIRPGSRNPLQRKRRRSAITGGSGMKSGHLWRGCRRI